MGELVHNWARWRWQLQTFALIPCREQKQGVGKCFQERTQDGERTV